MTKARDQGVLRAAHAVIRNYGERGALPFVQRALKNARQINATEAIEHWSQVGAAVAEMTGSNRSIDWKA